MQWFKLTGNYKPFWNNLSENIPDKHIEDIVKELNKEYNTTSWEPIKNKVELKDLNNCALYTDFKSMPNYLKMLNDDGTTFYFYLVDYTQIIGNKNGLNLLAVYELDRYMTIYYGKLQTLLNNHVNVLHLFKYCDRYNYDKEKNVININLLKMPQFNNSLNVFNFNYIRKPLIGFSSEDIYNNNFNNSIPAELKLYSWNPTVRNTWNCWIKTDFLNQPNKNKRYRYLVAKASALIDNLNYDISWKDAQHNPTFSSDAKIIIPIPDKMTLKMGEEPKVPAYMDITNKTLLNAFNAFDIKQTNDLTVSPLGNNFIGSYECDIPYSVWYGLSLREPDKVGFKFGYNKGVPYDEKTKQPINDLRIESVPIVFFIIDTNYAPRIKLINPGNKKNNTLTTKINQIIENIYKWLPETEPTLLTPLYYKEVYKQDNDASIETNLSYLDITIDETYTGFNTYAYLCYDSTLNIAYDYDKNNNDLNSYWNNSNSNLRNDINLNLGVYSSSATNYYNENSTAIITGIKNNQIEAEKINADTSATAARAVTGYFGSIASGVGAFFSGNWGAAFSAPFNAINNIVNSSVNIYKQRKQIEQNNLNLASNIKNIQTGSSTTLINPYIAGSIPNKDINNKTLFNIYSNELTDHNKAKVFNYILNNGYPFNAIAPINDYDNRQYMNVLHVDTSTVGDEILNLLLNKESNLFNNLTYNNAFLGWLNQKHKVYKTTHLINVTDFMAPDYIHNVENDLNLINKKNINDIIKNYDANLLIGNMDIANYTDCPLYFKLLAKATLKTDYIIDKLKNNLIKLNPNIDKDFLNYCNFNVYLNDNRTVINVSITSNNILIEGTFTAKLQHNNFHILNKNKDIIKNYIDYIVIIDGYNGWAWCPLSSRLLLKNLAYRNNCDEGDLIAVNYLNIIPPFEGYNGFIDTLTNRDGSFVYYQSIGYYEIYIQDPSRSIKHYIPKRVETDGVIVEFDLKNNNLLPHYFKGQEDLKQIENNFFNENNIMLLYSFFRQSKKIYEMHKNYLYVEGRTAYYNNGSVTDKALTAIKINNKKALYYYVGYYKQSVSADGYYLNYDLLNTFYKSIWFEYVPGSYIEVTNPEGKPDQLLPLHLLELYKPLDYKKFWWGYNMPLYNDIDTYLKEQSKYDKQNKTDIKKLQEK